MSKFQKTAIILGVVYLVFWIVGLSLDLLFGPDYYAPHPHINRIIKSVPFLIASSCTALLFIFNALHYKSITATIAAISSVAMFTFDVCGKIVFIIASYLRYSNNYYEYSDSDLGNIYSIGSIILHISLIFLIISVGFFADSHRKNKAILTSSIVYIFMRLFSDFGWILLKLAVDSEVLNIIGRTLAVLCALAFCSLFACAATIKNKNYE